MDILEYDHRIITDACDMARGLARNMVSGGPCPVSNIRMLIGFFHTFVDDCHCLKEERVLFTHLLKRRMSLFLGPVATLTTEHQKCRLLMNRVESLLDGQASEPNAATGALAELLIDYVSMEQDHLRKESESLFPMVAEMLSTTQLEPLTEEFLRIEQEALHGEPVEQYIRRLRQ